MDWLTSLPALLLLVSFPLMILLMVDAFTRNYTAHTDRTENLGRGRVISMARPEPQDPESEDLSRKAA